MSKYTENQQKWHELSDIDYFSYFIKAWISFNAWYKNTITDCNSDRDFINAIKRHNTTKFRKSFDALLRSTTTENDLFKSNLANLHRLLLDVDIKDNNDRDISFEKIFRFDDSNKEQNHDERGFKLYVNLTIRKYIVSNVLITITKDSRNLFKYTHNEYDEDHFEENFECSIDNSISNNQTKKKPILNKKDTLKSLLQSANPIKFETVLSNDTKKCIDCAGIKFVDDKDKLFSALVEVLYSLRNALFHGHIVPDKQTNKLYKEAYEVLKSILDGMSK